VALQLKLRLRGRDSFIELNRRGKLFKSGDLRIKIAKNGLDLSRFGFAIPKKRFNAVKRNRIKRVLSEWIRNNLGVFPLGFDYLIKINYKIKSVDMDIHSFVNDLEGFTAHFKGIDNG